ncbi:class III extradiol ring-cleavage dioxygenase family protein [Mycolicibacterium fortuitum]|uniref:Conserved alanine rich protein n=2 Tax=Mycolicibacterium fortuitum TaxID=1766 RepID=A0A0N7H8K4_MYCFO|nr:hypothetical protein [Mycolicibacterium fortuitum]ALI26471.1 hypothetical protein XA26_26280 [Mycolicibacterium fortuitum]MCV7140472.1 hypothetical protein [Mycolicibacterium fortuitum]MDG5773498.1 hypothetical protein [Mycolicibacterium fortuitum]MDG5784269.1 hypothetical protein [Mycolicibacterium fortuitum]MDV7191369.1 hypothetical protein [Mycolicibacterium fortuitum]
MLSAIAIVPATPVLVPELVGAAAAEVAGLRDAVIAAAGSLPPRWLAVGVGPRDAVYGPDCAGTFAGYGVDVPVSLGPGPAGEPAELPLCVLVAAWIRGQATPHAGVDVHAYAASSPVGEALAQGRALRARLDDSPDPVGVLVVADGLHTLTPSAPGGYLPDSVATQQDLDDALATGDVAALIELPEPVLGRVAFQVLAGLVGSEPGSARELYRGAPYGVGYFVGEWLP